MPKASETEIKNSILHFLSLQYSHGLFWPNDSTGIFDPVRKCYRRKNSKYWIRGTPDILGVVDGRSIGIEVKSASGSMSESQRNFADRFTAAGGIYVLARSIEDVHRAISGIRDRNHSERKAL